MTFRLTGLFLLCCLSMPMAFGQTPVPNKKTEKKPIQKRVIKNYIRVKETSDNQSVSGIVFQTLIKTFKPDKNKD